MSVAERTARCLEVDLNDKLISSAISPTDASLRFFRYFNIVNLRRFANAFNIFSRSFIRFIIPYCHSLILTNERMMTTQDYNFYLLFCSIMIGAWLNSRFARYPKPKLNAATKKMMSA